MAPGCPACKRRFVVIGEPPAPSLLCRCGATLAPMALAPGVYEIRPLPASRHEPDLGYAESHGYGPAHGGPSGPGDAPADESAPPDPEPPDAPRT